MTICYFPFFLHFGENLEYFSSATVFSANHFNNSLGTHYTSFQEILKTTFCLLGIFLLLLSL